MIVFKIVEVEGFVCNVNEIHHYMEMRQWLQGHEKDIALAMSFISIHNEFQYPKTVL